MECIHQLVQSCLLTSRGQHLLPTCLMLCSLKPVFSIGRLVQEVLSVLDPDLVGKKEYGPLSLLA